MALTLGTNVGFVTTAPTADPAGGDTTIDGSSVVVKDTSPAGAIKITEIGWYRGSGTNTANFEIALYAADGSGGIAGTRLFVDNSNSSSAGGWITVAVDWAISPSTAYWLGLQMDAHTGTSTVDSATSGGSGIDVRTSQTALNNPYGGGTVSDADGMYAIYALYQSAPTVVLNSPDDAGSTSDTTPDLTFTGTDPEANDIRYQIQIDAVPFASRVPLSDTFSNGSTIDGDWAIDTAGGTVVQGSGVITLTPTTNSVGECKIYATFNVNLTGKQIFFKLNQFATGAKIDNFIHLANGGDYNNRLMFFGGGGGGDLEAISNVGGSFDSIGLVTYNSTTQAWLRFREASGTVYWDYSADCLNWTNLASQANPFSVTNLTFVVGTYEWANEATPGTFVFDNVNVSPYLIDAVSGTDAGFSNIDTDPTDHTSDTDPFYSGDQIQYTVQSALSLTTYYWRVRGIDPSGSNTYGAWSSTRSFTVTSASGTNMRINIGDTWKTVTGLKINIGDSWKTVTHAKINVGDVWKSIF